MEKVESDHMPMVVEIWHDGNHEEEKKQEEEIRKHKMKICWDEETRKIYNENTERTCWEGGESARTIEEKWRKLKSIIKGTVIQKEIKVRKKKLGEKDW